MNLLILLTASFPYDGGEEFLLSEIQYISGFDRVVICPCNLKADSKITKPLPEGIGCFPVRRVRGTDSSYAKILPNPDVLREAAALLFTGRLSSQRVHEMLYFMRNARGLFTALKDLPELKRADRVTIYSYWFYDAAAAGVLLAEMLRKRGVSVTQISRAHGFDVYPERAAYGYLPMRRFLLRHLDRLYPCSRDGTDAIARQYPRYAGKISTAFLGTADHGLKPGKRGSGFRLLSCSYMVPVKRLDRIAEALMQADFPVTWTHIGAGPMEEEIRRMAEALPSCVHAEFKGRMDNGAIMDYYRSHDISAFVNVSSSEGIPVSIMEACSFGIPVVATAVGGTPEAVRDGINGFLLPADFSPGELLSKIRTLRGLPAEKYEDLCRNSRGIWEEKFHAARNYRKFYEVIGR